MILSHPKRLCMIAYTDYEVDARVVRMAEAARDAGYGVDLLTPRRQGAQSKANEDGLNHYRLFTKLYRGGSRSRYVISYLAFFVQCLGFVTALHLIRRYRLVHVHNMPDFLVFTAAAAWALGARIILDIHDPMPELYAVKFPGGGKRFAYRLLRLQERWSAAFSSKILAVHEPLKKYLVKSGLDAAKIAVVTNFPDGRIFLPRPRKVRSSQLRIIYYGTIDFRFGLEDILEAVAPLIAKRQFCLKIVGKGDCENHLKRLIHNLNLKDSVDFENRLYPLRQIPALVADFDLGLAPYRINPATQFMLPVKFVELLAMGVPAITVANVAVRRYFDQSLYFAYDPERMDTFTKQVALILDHPELLDEKRRTILAQRERFLWASEERKYHQVLGDLDQESER